MKIGILVMFVNSFGKRGLYNSQEIGMAKEMRRRGHTVTIYKCVENMGHENSEELHPGLTYQYKQVKSLGNNAISDFQWLDSSMDALVCFCDIQLLVFRVHNWSKKNHVRFIPYVGITESTSKSILIRSIINLNAKLIFRIYNKTGVLVKTNAIKNKLARYGVKEIKVAPVGLDFDLMYQDYKKQDINLLKETLGLDCDSNYMLLVGRLDNDRNPLDCISVFERIHSKNQRYKLLIIGKGSLKEELFSQMKNINLHQYVDYIEQVPNDEMWKYYRVADCLISLSKTEIFGMSLLEAMYYETPVYVIHAPGPNDIIVNNVTGYLFASPEKMADAIVKEQFDRVKEPSHSRVVNEFSWKTAVEAIETLC